MACDLCGGFGHVDGTHSAAVCARYDGEAALSSHVERAKEDRSERKAPPGGRFLWSWLGNLWTLSGSRDGCLPIGQSVRHSRDVHPVTTWLLVRSFGANEDGTKQGDLATMNQI